MKKSDLAVFLGLNIFAIVFLNICIFRGIGVPAGLFSSAVSMLVFAFVLLSADRLNKGYAQRCKTDCIKTDSSTMSMLLELSVPCVLCDENGEILWYNHAASDIFFDSENEELPKFIENLDFEQDGEITVNYKTYQFNTAGCGRDGNMRLVTFFDVSELKALKEKCTAIRSVICYITVDNYSDVMSGISGNEAGKITIEIEERLADFAERAAGVVHRLERDRFVVFLDMDHLEVLMADKFSIVSAVKEIKGTNDIPVTVSVGAGLSYESNAKSALFARAAMELALGRGGDQAVVKIGDEFKFFGGASREAEKKTKVRARVMAQALCEIIGNSNQVIIMGHENADADSFGAAVGIFRIAESLGVRARIVVDGLNTAVQREVARFREFKEYSFVFISPQQTSGLMNEKTAVILVDTHLTDRAEVPGLLNQTSKVVVIDHHRRSADYIKNTILTYHEPSASSASEMVTEIIQYTDFGNQLTKHEAEALFAGIMLDTKNFAVKTSVRTFDAAAFLRKRGVDTNAVREFFRTNFNDYKKRMQLVAAAENYREITVISKSDDADVEICASAADELLNISGIQASFVLTAFEDGVHISARSSGVINVQLITEKLGGGGHMTVAGAQLDCSLFEAEDRLKEVIDSYFAESY